MLMSMSQSWSVQIKIVPHPMFEKVSLIPQFYLPIKHPLWFSWNQWHQSRLSDTFCPKVKLVSWCIYCISFKQVVLCPILFVAALHFGVASAVWKYIKRLLSSWWAYQLSNGDLDPCTYNFVAMICRSYKN